MITSFAIIPKPVESPEESKASIEAILLASGVTGFFVTLNGADTEAYRFRVEATETSANRSRIVKMFGAFNTSDRAPRTQAMNARAAKQQFRVAGAEGRFAKENPPPSGAK